MTAEKYCAPERGLRYTAGKIGLTMLFHTLLIDLLFLAEAFVEFIVRAIADEFSGIFGIYAADIAAGLLEAATYLLAFMLPVAFYAIITPRSMHRPMNLGVSLPTCTWAIILFALAANTAASYLNYYFVSSLGIPAVSAGEGTTDAVGIILSFINVALVPAICEEFLFRGCILSALLPYGKSTAVIGSALLFALMHNNIWQFFYTCIAGIILGAVYVATGSIWAGTFIHLFNNFSSVLMAALGGRTNEAAAAVISGIYDAVLLAAGLAAGVWLILHEKKPEIGENERSDAAAPESFRGFFAPAMIVYFVIATAIALIAEVR